MHTIEYTSVVDLHTDIQSRIRDHKRSEPMAAVVLVTDTPLQGLLLRRQLVDSSEAGAVGNIQVKMIDEVISDIFKHTGYKLSSSPSAAALDAACYSAMLTNATFASAGSDALTTASGISSVYSKLRFNTDIELQTLLSGDLSDTQKAVIETVIAAREVLHSKLGVARLPEKMEDVIGAIKSGSTTKLPSVLYLVLTENLPKLVTGLFDCLETCVRYEISPVESKIKTAERYFSAPDPQTEAALAVSQLVELVDSDTEPSEIAIVYSNESQYVRLLGTALDDAGISWHGAMDKISQSSNLYRGFNLILQMLEERTIAKSGADRSLVMRLLESGDFYVDDMLLDSNLCRQFVRDKEIYGDAISWLKVIGKLPNATKPREVKAAGELKALLKALQRGLQNIADATNWTEFGSELFEIVRSFYLGANEDNLSDDEKNVARMFKQLLLQELPELDLLKPEHMPGLTPSASAVISFIDRKIGQKNSRHGALSVGVHVSSSQEVRVLKFKKIVLVGATDGLLPSPSNEMAFLTDRMLESLGELGRSAIAATEKPDLIGRHLSAIVHGKPLVVTRSRSAMNGKLDNVPSRFLDRDLIPQEILLPSYTSLHTSGLDLTVASKSIQVTATSIAHNTDLDSSQVRTLEALSIFRSPANTGYFGQVDTIPEQNSIGANPVSASAIEAFIDCEYKFFVTRTLGFYTGEREDVLDIWRAKDFGNLIHNSMEHFLNDLSDRDELPDGKTKFSEGQVNSFFKDYLDEELKDFYAKGHDVWRAGFEALMERVRANLRDFFATELMNLRSADELAVHASELAFGKEELEKDRTTLAVPGREPVELIGRIDRVDLNSARESAAVLDFKSGKLRLSELQTAIGKPKSREPNKGIVKRTKVQDLVYTVALRKKFPSLNKVEVTFAYISSGTKTEYVKAEWAEPAEEKLAEILEKIYQAEEHAEFSVSHSSKIGDNTYCDVCQRLGWVSEQLRLEYMNKSGLVAGGDEDE
jgi:hypothetical protein